MLSFALLMMSVLNSCSSEKEPAGTIGSTETAVTAPEPNVTVSMSHYSVRDCTGSPHLIPNDMSSVYVGFVYPDDLTPKMTEGWVAESYSDDEGNKHDIEGGIVGFLKVPQGYKLTEKVLDLGSPELGTWVGYVDPETKEIGKSDGGLDYIVFYGNPENESRVAEDHGVTSSDSLLMFVLIDDTYILRLELWVLGDTDIFDELDRAFRTISLVSAPKT